MRNCNMSSISDPEKLGAYESIPAGYYTMIVTDVSERVCINTKSGTMECDKVEFEVIDGTVTGQAGRKITQTYFDDRSGNMGQGLIRLIWASGIMQPGQSGNVDLQALNGRYVVVELIESKPNDRGQKYVNIGQNGCSTWPIGHPTVKGVPGSAPVQQAPQAQAPQPQQQQYQAPQFQQAPQQPDPNRYEVKQFQYMLPQAPQPQPQPQQQYQQQPQSPQPQPGGGGQPAPGNFGW